MLCQTYLLILEEQNKLKLTPEIKGELKPFFSRPLMIVNVEDIIDELEEIIQPPLKDLKPLGSLDQFINCTEIQSNSKLAKKALGFFD